MPRVSVIIPTCNRPEFLPRALRSVLDQTYQDFEIIVVDDGDKISAEKEVKSFGNGRIKYIKHEKRRGGAAARNTGIGVAHGEFIAFLDDDDEWLPEKLEKKVSAFEQSGDEVGVVFCGVAISSPGGVIKQRIYDKEGIVDVFGESLHKCFIWTSALMIRREALIQVGMFDESFKKNQEWDLELRLAKVNRFFSIKEALVKINSHAGGQMGSIKNIDNIISGFESLVKKHHADYQEQKKSLALRYFQLADLYCYKDDRQKVRSMLLMSWINFPLNAIYLIHLLIFLLSPSLYKHLKSKSNDRFF